MQRSLAKGEIRAKFHLNLKSIRNNKQDKERSWSKSSWRAPLLVRCVTRASEYTHTLRFLRKYFRSAAHTLLRNSRFILASENNALWNRCANEFWLHTVIKSVDTGGRKVRDIVSSGAAASQTHINYGGEWCELVNTPRVGHNYISPAWYYINTFGPRLSTIIIAPSPEHDE
jgi:hypothetical protein